MLNLPETTVFNKRIPKEKFYAKMDVPPKVKRAFIDQIQAISWRHKIAPATTNLAPGNTVMEIQVFEIALRTPSLDEEVLRQIDRQIPYHLIHLLTYEGKVQAWVAYKEASAGKTPFKVDHFYHTEWLEKEDLALPLEGLHMDAVYENLVYMIAGDLLQEEEEGSLQEAVASSEERKKLEKKIQALEKKVRKEKQLNLQMKLNSQLKQLKKELEALTHG